METEKKANHEIRMRHNASTGLAT